MGSELVEEAPGNVLASQPGTEIPAVNGHGSARAITGFYAALLEGRSVGSHDVENALRTTAYGVYHRRELGCAEGDL